MRSGSWLDKINAEAVQKEHDEAVKNGLLTRAAAIKAANPDVFVENESKENSL